MGWYVETPVEWSPRKTPPGEALIICRYCGKPILPTDACVRAGWNWYHEWCWGEHLKRLDLSKIIKVYGGKKGTALIRTKEGNIVRVDKALAYALKEKGLAEILEED